MKTKLQQIEKVLKNYPNMNVKNMNENEVHVIWEVAYTTPERLEEIRKKIGARRVCITWTPSMISKGIVLFFEL